jgi:hypothetical protein
VVGEEVGCDGNFLLEVAYAVLATRQEANDRQTHRVGECPETLYCLNVC